MRPISSAGLTPCSLLERALRSLAYRTSSRGSPKLAHQWFGSMLNNPLRRSASTRTLWSRLSAMNWPYLPSCHGRRISRATESAGPSAPGGKSVMVRTTTQRRRARAHSEGAGCPMPGRIIRRAPPRALGNARHGGIGVWAREQCETSARSSDGEAGNDPKVRCKLDTLRFVR